MCLSSVYQIKNGNKALIANDVCELISEKGMFTVADILGKKTVIAGVVKSIDLLRNIIIIETSDS